jgi:hypothetical protein
MLQELVETKLLEIEVDIDLLKRLDLSPYCASAAFLSAREKLQASTIAASSSAHLYDDVDFQLIETFEDWTAALVSPHAESTTITSSPTFSVVKPLHLSGDVFIDVHLIENFPENGDIPGVSRVLFRDSRPVLAGEAFAIPAGEFASTLRGAVKGSQFLRISGPVRVPIVLSFDRKSLGFSSVSFSDSESTGKHFFIQLIESYLKSVELMRPQVDSNFSKNLNNFLEYQLDSDIHLFTKWKIMQILARTKKEPALNFLNKLHQSTFPNARNAASKALYRIKLQHGD